MFYDHDGLMEQYSAATTIDAATNPTTNGHEFEQDFPAGTGVYDESARTHAIVTDDGNRAPISDSELRAGLSHAALAARGTWRGKA